MICGYIMYGTEIDFEYRMRKCVYYHMAAVKKKNRLWGVFDTLFRTSHFSPQYFSLTTQSSTQHSFIHTNIPRGVFHKILNCMNQCIQYELVF